MKRIVLVLLMCFCICGCGSVEENSVITNEQIEKIMLEEKYVIIDVRTKEEYDTGHIKDALNIPYDIIDENIEIEKDTIIFVYCRSGNRSSIAYNTLKTLGYEVYDLGGYANIDLPKEE